MCEMFVSKNKFKNNPLAGLSHFKIILMRDLYIDMHVYKYYYMWTLEADFDIMTCLCLSYYCLL
jgi:hypothetical protein